MYPKSELPPPSAKGQLPLLHQEQGSSPPGEGKAAPGLLGLHLEPLFLSSRLLPCRMHRLHGAYTGPWKRVSGRPKRKRREPDLCLSSTHTCMHADTRATPAKEPSFLQSRWSQCPRQLCLQQWLSQLSGPRSPHFPDGANLVSTLCGQCEEGMNGTLSNSAWHTSCRVKPEG